MAFSTSVHDRHLDERRFRNIEGQQFPSPTSYAPLRNAPELGHHNQASPSAPADVRTGLTRRFTADAMITPPISSVWDQSRLPRIPVSESMDASGDEDVRILVWERATVVGWVVLTFVCRNARRFRW